MKNILHISPDFNYSCGVSKLVFLTLSYFDQETKSKTHFITNGGDSLARLKTLRNIHYELTPFSRGLRNIFYYNSFSNYVKRYGKKNRIDIIHTYHRFPEFVSNKIAKVTGIKTITSALSFVEGYNKISFQSDKVICEGDYIKNMLVNHFNVPEKKIIKMYLPAEKFKPLTKKEKEELKGLLNIREGEKVLLFVGKINYQKGFDKLLEAYKIVHSKMSDAILIMCGNIESSEFHKIRNKLNMPVLVIPPNEDYYKLYQVADIVILPSRTDPFPFVMIESGTNKKPFIGGNTGGIAEFIEDGIDGVLVDSKNGNELSEKILLLLNNKNIAEQLGNNLQKKVNEKCGYDNYFRRLEEIYNSLLY